MEKRNLVRTGLLVASLALLGALLWAVTASADAASAVEELELGVSAPAGWALDGAGVAEFEDGSAIRASLCLTCTFVADIRFRGRAFGDKSGVQSAVTVYGQEGPVPGAKVLSRWELSTGEKKWALSQTNSQGRAVSAWTGCLTCTYTVCVYNVVKSGYEYDPASNLETCDTFSLP